MTNEQRLNEIVELVENLKTEEIAEVFFKKDNKGKFLCPWPEHQDRNGSSFLLNKNHTFKCFSCGNRPVFSIHNYIKEIYGIEDIKQSCLFIAFQCNLISEDEYLNLKKFQDITKTKMKIKYQTREEKETIKLKPLDINTLHNIYSIFCMGKSLTLNKNGEIEIKPELKLSKEHYQYLKNERQLSDEEIKKYGYFTYPKYSFLKPFLVQMSKMGYNKDILIRVPGLFYNKDKKNINFKVYRNKEYLAIPIVDENGKIRGIQLRADNVENGQNRYIWVSSANIDEKKFLGNLSPNSPVNVIYPNISQPKTIVVTEGHFKAVKITNTLNVISLSVQGINNWKPVLEIVKRIKNKFPKIKDIIIMYDADMAYKLQVLQSAIAISMNLLNFDINNKNYIDYMRAFKIKKSENGKFNFEYDNNNEIIHIDEFIKARNLLISELRNFDSFINVSICVWDYNFGKGFDDFIINTNNLDGFIYLPFSEFIYKLSFILEELLGVKDVSPNDFFELFREYFLSDYSNFKINKKNETKNCCLETIEKKLNNKTNNNIVENIKGGLEIVHF